MEGAPVAEQVQDKQERNDPEHSSQVQSTQTLEGAPVRDQFQESLDTCTTTGRVQVGRDSIMEKAQNSKQIKDEQEIKASATQDQVKASPVMEGAHVSDQTLDELSQALELVQDNENQEWSTEEDTNSTEHARGVGGSPLMFSRVPSSKSPASVAPSSVRVLKSALYQESRAPDNPPTLTSLSNQADDESESESSLEQEATLISQSTEVPRVEQFHEEKDSPCCGEEILETDEPEVIPDPKERLEPLTTQIKEGARTPTDITDYLEKQGTSNMRKTSLKIGVTVNDRDNTEDLTVTTSEIIERSNSLTVTSAPVTSAPVTSAPVTSAPVTSAPVTNSPSTEDSVRDSSGVSLLDREPGLGDSLPKIQPVQEKKAGPKILRMFQGVKEQFKTWLNKLTTTKEPSPLCDRSTQTSSFPETPDKDAIKSSSTLDPTNPERELTHDQCAAATAVQSTQPQETWQGRISDDLTTPVNVIHDKLLPDRLPPDQIPPDGAPWENKLRGENFRSEVDSGNGPTDRDPPDRVPPDKASSRHMQSKVSSEETELGKDPTDKDPSDKVPPDKSSSDKGRSVKNLLAKSHPAKKPLTRTQSTRNLPVTISPIPTHRCKITSSSLWLRGKRTLGPGLQKESLKRSHRKRKWKEKC